MPHARVKTRIQAVVQVGQGFGRGSLQVVAVCQQSGQRG